MNYLEELELPALGPQKENAIADELSPLIVQLEVLDQSAQATARLAKDSTTINQIAIIDELYKWNKQKMEENNKMLHDNISKEADIKRNLQKIEQGGVLNGNPEDVKTLKRKLKETHEKIVSLIEEIDYEVIGKIKGLSKNQAAPSFHRLWVWVLEVFYGFPASKYYWPEFKAKAFSKDKGKELKRRMITQNLAELTDTEKLELNELTEIHRKVIKDYVQSLELAHFLEAIDLMKVYIDTYDEYHNINKKGVENMDVNAVREEENKVLKASARFNSVKYDVVTEMQNILFLINHEFKPRREA